MSIFRVYCDLPILHPGAVKLIMTLLPSIYCPSDLHVSIQRYMSYPNYFKSNKNPVYD